MVLGVWSVAVVVTNSWFTGSGRAQRAICFILFYYYFLNLPNYLWKIPSSAARGTWFVVTAGRLGAGSFHRDYSLIFFFFFSSVGVAVLQGWQRGQLQTRQLVPAAGGPGRRHGRPLVVQAQLAVRNGQIKITLVWIFLICLSQGLCKKQNKKNITLYSKYICLLKSRALWFNSISCNSRGA